MADGEYHSGEALGQAVGVSRAAVWKNLQHLIELGLNVERTKGRGYCLLGGVSLLSSEQIVASPYIGLEVLSGGLGTPNIQVKQSIDSTNKYMLECIAEGQDVDRAVCLAEMQTAGRGRRGRAWVSPYASNIYMSIARRFTQGVASMEGLSLAVGVVICDALQALGVDGVSLKWPNDVLYRGKKLGGVLLEISGDLSGDCHVVVGVGLNVAMRESQADAIGQPWVSLAQILDGEAIARNDVAAAMVGRLLPMLETYESAGFAAYRSRWESLNAHQGQAVIIQSGTRGVDGQMLGVTDSGALKLLVDGTEQCFVGGELSLRAKR